VTCAASSGPSASSSSWRCLPPRAVSQFRERGTGSSYFRDEHGFRHSVHVSVEFGEADGADDLWRAILDAGRGALLSVGFLPKTVDQVFLDVAEEWAEVDLMHRSEEG
jgi:hypothetical protein